LLLDFQTWKSRPRRRGEKEDQILRDYCRGSSKREPCPNPLTLKEQRIVESKRGKKKTELVKIFRSKR